MPETCQKCEHQKEQNVGTLIFAASMREDIRKDSSLYDELNAKLEAISPILNAEFKERGIQHCHADKTLTELKKIYS